MKTFFGACALLALSATATAAEPVNKEFLASQVALECPEFTHVTVDQEMRLHVWFARKDRAAAQGCLNNFTYYDPFKDDPSARSVVAEGNMIILR